MLMELLKILKLYMNCGIIAVVVDIILSIMGNFLSTAQKHNRQNFEHITIIGRGLSIRC